MAAFNNTAIGAGSTRQKYEKRLLVFLRKAFEVILAFFSFFSHSIIEVCSFFHAQIFFYPFFFFFDRQSSFILLMVIVSCMNCLSFYA